MDDPKRMAQWMRRMQKEMGDEVTPEFDQMVEEMESEDGRLEDGGEEMDE